MPVNSWPENDSYREFEPLSSLFSDLSESDDVPAVTYPGYAGRCSKAALVLMIVWSITIALHLYSWGTWLVLGLTTMLGIHVLLVLLAKPLPTPPVSSPLTENCPYISLLVAAKNEEAVIGRLVKTLASLDYPIDQYELWVIDDNSTDRTPILLEALQQEYSNLKVFRRGAGARGGKSGALNQVLPLTKGEIVAVFDADAQVTPDLLQQVLPLFAAPQVGAVQVRKAIANAEVNFWTRSQSAEMALDAFLQQRRIAIKGIGELRGNGQFVRRTALERCGGWNEATITDDLDLTLRLHLDRWDIQVLASPPVEEEGVTGAISLWHQRNRWGEGGYQRYLDYWRLIFSNRLGTRKTLDLWAFILIQYILPTAMIPDFLMAIALRRFPILVPLGSLSFSISLIGMFIGLSQIRKKTKSLGLTDRFDILIQTLRGSFYMLHWFLVISSTTARMSIRSKRLKWIKTVHKGTFD